MNELNRYQQIIDGMIERTRFEGKPENLYEPMNYIMSLGGKRLRPMLTLIACDLFNGDINKAIFPALGIELFHNFSLIHDDIMDEAPLRRGMETVHIKWNMPTAILSGDLMLVKAYEFMLKTESLARIKVLDLFTQTAAQVCEGQQWDMDFEKREDVTVNEYLKMIEYKTAVLLGCALKTGAITAQAHDNDADLLYDFGVSMGIAFQIMDDILDAFGDPDKVGKQVGGDILADKKTYLLIEAYHLADASQKARLNQWVGNKEANPELKVKEVLAIFSELDIEGVARRKADEYFSKADRLLDAVAIEGSRKENLKAYSQFLKNRVS